MTARTKRLIFNEIWMSDASGDRLRCSGEDLGAFNGQFSRIEGDEIVCLHRWEFWADEPAWKLSVHFEQPTNTNGCWMDYLVRPRFLHTESRRQKGAKTRSIPHNRIISLVLVPQAVGDRAGSTHA
jgi:hypothetical protein